MIGQQASPSSAGISFQIVDRLGGADGCACIIGPYLVYQYTSN